MRSFFIFLLQLMFVLCQRVFLADLFLVCIILRYVYDGDDDGVCVWMCA